MKRVLIIAAFIFLFPAISLADFDAVGWKFAKEIRGSGDLVRFTLDDEIFSGAKRDLSDIRVIDSLGKETPFKMLSGLQQAKINAYHAKTINNSYLPGQYSSAILDLGFGGAIANSITIETLNENFQRNVKIYGSNDMETWNILRDNAYIYDYTDKRGNLKTQNTTVNFPDSAFRYLKVEVQENGDSPLVMKGFMVNQKTEERSRENQRKLNFTTSDNGANRSSELLADLGLDGIPVTKIEFSVSDINYNRGVAIYSSNDNTNWSAIGYDYIFKYDTPKFSGEKSTVTFPETNRRYIKIEIYNHDNSPLQFNGLMASEIVREIVFQAGNRDGFRVYYGNAKARYPQYDMDKYFQYLDPQSAKTASLSTQLSNAAYVPEKEPVRPLSERIPYLLPVGLTIVSLFLIFMVYRFMKD